MSVCNTKSLSSGRCPALAGAQGHGNWECAPTYLPRVLARLKSAALQQLPGTLHLKTPKEQGGLVGRKGWEAWGSLVPSAPDLLWASDTSVTPLWASVSSLYRTVWLNDPLGPCFQLQSELRLSTPTSVVSALEFH